MSGRLRLVVDNSTRGKPVEPTRRDRGAMSTRFTQMEPETATTIQSELERGQIVNWSDCVDRMFQKDPDILSGYESRLSVISAAELVVEPGELVGDPVRDAATIDCSDWTRRWMSRMPVAQYAHESLDGIGRGLAAHEIERAATSDGLVPVAMHWLSTRRFCYGEDWHARICDMGGDVPYRSAGYEIEPDRFVLHEPRVLPGYPCGGVLRPVLWLFVIKGWAVQFWLTGAERYAWPTTVGTAPRSADGSARARMQELMEDLSADHTMVLDTGMAVQLLETTVKDARTWSTLVDWCDRGIGKALNGMTDLAEPSRVGSYAAVETRAGKTVDARVLKDERALATTWTRDIVEPAIRHNAARWPVRPETPRIGWAIAAKSAALDPIGVLAMRVDEVRSRQGLRPLGGTEGAMFWKDFTRAGGAA